MTGGASVYAATGGAISVAAGRLLDVQLGDPVVAVPPPQQVTKEKAPKCKEKLNIIMVAIVII